MKEEIIIDNVDVAGCEFLRNCIIPDNYGCKIDDSLCCDVGNCYYKQLKRLEQENKELKETIKQYCEWLDEERESNEKLQKVYQNDHCDLLKYRSALEEIKNDFMCFRSCMIPFHIGNKENLPHNMADAIQNYCESIMNKINEVLNK